MIKASELNDNQRELLTQRIIKMRHAYAVEIEVLLSKGMDLVQVKECFEDDEYLLEAGITEDQANGLLFEVCQLLDIYG